MFVSDGPRDEASLPGLVQNILRQTVAAEFSAWAHLRNPGKGFDRKLRFATALTRSKKLSGLVAVADRDDDHKNLRRKSLEASREQLRREGEILPIAVGVADPHVDVWLLDDATA